MNRPLLRIEKPATYQDILNAPADMVAELINGALHLQPRPGARHGFAGSRLGIKIGSPFDLGDDQGPGEWWIIDESEVHLGDDDVVVPYIAGWRRDRMPVFPDTAAIEITPDWACEVLSPSTRQFDLTEKCRLHGLQGVEYLWFVDPNARTLEAFVNKAGDWMLVTAIKDDDSVSVQHFEAIEFLLSALWPD